MNTEDKIWSKMMKIGVVFGCHQLAERSFFFKGYQFPVCARCTGIFIGQIISVLMCIFKIKTNILISIISIITMVIDGGIQYFKILESTNFRRFTTGILGGFGYLNIVIFIVRHIFN